MKALSYIGLVLIAATITVFCVIFEVWDFAEPLICFLSLAFAAKTWQQTRVAKKATYEDTDNGDADYYIALQCGVPVAMAINNQFGQLDCLLDIKDLLGKANLDNANDYEVCCKAIWQQISKNQNKKIHLFMSGTVGLSMLAGQMLQSNIFNITVYQFDAQSRKYFALPKIDNSWKM
jgi:hypothetical protein